MEDKNFLSANRASLFFSVLEQCFQKKDTQLSLVLWKAAEQLQEFALQRSLRPGPIERLQTQHLVRRYIIQTKQNSERLQVRLRNAVFIP